ncbi:TPA: phage tail tape measure protein [Yersinia enterocolitica]|nr:phage tail tape measure protein [Yersinia enterocolitica]HDL8028194.1 phage tail tape measure protein [Yersinia enterocolitica]HDL8161313.1 phage tail tape measure protein [Yersinia enterocolitica]HDL8165346.1 phage tail tape measure protein [Yersinia enterocolitica]HDL8169212.1 phage tail tape measure protein [Yersinia enterocolitica]
MSNAIVLQKINELRRDALVNYAISKKTFGNGIESADELYQHLLLDTKIGAEVNTSPVAEAISSLQLYIERCIEGAEPEPHTGNVAKHFSTDKFLHNWNLYNKRYSRWAGKEKLKYYAADYIDPTLRYNKTELFTAFEQNINQGKLTENAVTKAIQKYLSSFEKLARLETIGYINVAENKTQFFLGRSQEVPCQYYWRSCSQAEANDKNNLIWSEWVKINNDIFSDVGEEPLYLQWYDGRLNIIWLGIKTTHNKENHEVKEEYYHCVYKDSDNSWVNAVEIKLSPEDKASEKFITTADISLTDHIYELQTNINLPAKGDISFSTEDNNDRFDAHIHEKFILPRGLDFFYDIDEVRMSQLDTKALRLDYYVENESDRFLTFRESAGVKFILKCIARMKFIDKEKILSNMPEGMKSPDPLPLINYATINVDYLLDYGVQDKNVGLESFNQSYGIYLWELFFHIPLLASARFLAEQRYDEAERWLKFIFNSAGYRNESGELQKIGDQPRYWNTLPLQQNNDWDSNTALATNDPDVIAMKDPMQYKLAVFMRTLDVLISRGDQAYRQLERDTLVEAKMYYVQANQLLGPRPTTQLTHNWKNQSLKETAPAIEDNFLPPYNEVLLSYWDKLAIRLHNLRHNLSLDGQPLHLPLFATPVDPQELQRQHAAGSGISGALNPVAAATSLYRFPLLLERAKSAVGSVMQLGNALQNALERQDNEAMVLLLQQQQQRVLQQTRDIQNANIGILQSSRKAVSEMVKSAETRRDYYKQLIKEGISADEQKALEMRIAAQILGLTAIVPIAIGGGLDMAPNVFGLADGGSRWGAVAQAAGWGIQITAGGIEQGAGIHEVKANYLRRTDEWQLQQTLAEKDVAQIKEQLTGLDLQISMAEKQHDLAEMEQSHAMAVYQMQSTRFSGKELYNWMVGRLSGLYYQLFDAAQPLCMMAKSALARDIDASKTDHLFINSGWSDLYQGLLAGEDLMLNLQKLENIWLKEDARALEVERTISLAQVYEKSAKFNLSDKVSGYLNGTGSDTEEAKDGNGVSIHEGILSASVSIKTLALDNDYPAAMQLGQKRRIKQISVSLPALLGPYQDVQATLSYDGQNTGLANGCTAIAISRGMNDSGQFQLDFNDGKYLPFEGIDINDGGALVLRFPNANDQQKALLQSLSDIILHIRYTIRS